jgi:hypothetical protein
LLKEYENMPDAPAEADVHLRVMLSFEDPRWNFMLGGYRVPFDPRPWLSSLERGEDRKAVWEAFWEDLHHQGDVGEASYATVPYLVRIYRGLGVFDWNAYAIAGVIELCRGEGQNPPLPEFLQADYFRALQDLAAFGITQFSDARDPEDVRAILSILALAKGIRLHAKFLLEYGDDELKEMQDRL